jgi:hypothetical protein
MPGRDAWLVVEIAALVVSMLSLVLQGLQARWESVKDKGGVVESLIWLYVKLDAWRSRGAATNSELHAWLDPVVGADATASPEEIQRIVNENMPGSMVEAARSQSGFLMDINSNSDLWLILPGLLRVYGPDESSGEQLLEALDRRDVLVRDLGSSLGSLSGDLVRGLFSDFYSAAGDDDRDALADLLNEADETLRLVNEGADMLRAFIRGNIPIEMYEARAPSLK